MDNNNGDKLAINILNGIKKLYQFSDKVEEVIGEADHVYEILEMFEEYIYEYVGIPHEDEIYCRDYVYDLMCEYQASLITPEEMLNILKEHVNEYRNELLQGSK